MKIDEYLDQLCGALQVEPLRRDEIRLETHGHLRERTDVYLQQRMTPDEAESKAVQEFGSPDHLAEHLSAAHPSNAPWRVSRHLHNIGVLLVGFSIQEALKFSFQVVTPGMSNHRLIWLGYAVYMALFISPPLMLGVSLLRNRMLPRWPALLFTFLNPWILCLIGICVWNSWGNRKSFSLMSLWWGPIQLLGSGGAFLILLGSYAIWAYRHSPKQNRVAA